MNKLFHMQFQVAARSLRLLANALEVADSQQQIKNILQGLQTTSTLLYVVLGWYERTLIANMAVDVPASEIESLI